MHYKAKFKSGTGDYELVGFELKRSKFPYRARRISDGKEMLFTDANYYWLAVALLALASIGHQAWSANLFAIVMDVFPKNATASVTGIGGMVGAGASLLSDIILGKVLTMSGPSGYFFAFLLAGSVYIIALGVMQVLMPKMSHLGPDLRPLK